MVDGSKFLEESWFEPPLASFPAVPIHFYGLVAASSPDLFLRSRSSLRAKVNFESYISRRRGSNPRTFLIHDLIYMMN